MRRILIITAVSALVPAIAFAQTASTLTGVLGLLNIVVGLLLVASIGAMIGGFTVYLVYLGSDYRDRGLKLMAWGATILFVNVILVAIADIIQSAFFALVGFVLIFVVFVALTVSLSKSTSGSSPEVKH